MLFDGVNNRSEMKNSTYIQRSQLCGWLRTQSAVIQRDNILVDFVCIQDRWESLVLRGREMGRKSGV